MTSAHNRHSMRSRVLAAPAVAAFLLLPALASCIKDNEVDYTQWKADNEQYVSEQQQRTAEDGTPYYEQLTVDWLPGVTVLVHWHKRPADHDRVMKPLDNSTVDIKYAGRLYDQTAFDDSYSRTTYGDSIYRCRPNQMVRGFWATLTQMVPGDSVTVVIPAIAAYGVSGNGSTIKPYSALEFDIMMKRVVSYETPS